MKITFGEHTLDVALWRKALQDLAQRVSQNIDDLCYHQDFGLSIPEKVPDDWTNTERNYGWTGNAEFVPDSLGLLHHMLKDESLQLAKVNSEGKLELKSAAMWKFLESSAVINQDLARLCFFVNGQNTRISEFVEHKHKNSSRPRTCLYDDHTNSIWLVTRRLKTKQETFIPLKCPPLVTDLLRKYLTIIRPVEEHIAFHVRGTEARTLYREYLWVQNCVLMQKQTMYNMIPDFLEATINSRIGVHDYRQIAVEMSRCFLGSEFEMEQEELDTLAAQRGHTEETARKRYASEVGHLPGLSSELLLRFGRSSEKWWHVSGFKPGAPPLLPLKTRQELLSKQTPRAEKIPADANESGHTSIVPQDLAAILAATTQDIFLNMQTTLLAEMKETLSKCLPDMSRIESQIQDMVTKAINETRQDMSRPFSFSTPPPFSASEPSSFTADYNMETSDHAEDSSAAPHDPISHDADDIYEGYVPPDTILPVSSTAETQPTSLTREQTEYQPSTQTKDYLHHLLSLHFPDIHEPFFKSPTQMQAVEMALTREENFVLIMPTGSGKSLVFTLPPFNETGFRTYVIVPNKALLNDHLERCKKIGLNTFHWLSKHRGIPEDAQVVFLALETATSQTFRK